MKNVNCASHLSNSGIFSTQHDPNDFLSQLVTMDETWLYHHDLETKQQPMEWWHSSSLCPAPKNSEWKNPQKSSRLDFLGSRRHSPHWLPLKGPNYQCGVLLISAGVAVEGHFEGKMPAGRLLRWTCSCTTMPQLTGHLQPRRNWPTWASNVFITHPILQIWPCWTMRKTTTKHTVTVALTAVPGKRMRICA